MTTQRRLLDRLREMGLPLPEGTELRRTNYRGSVAAGAWRWRAYGPDGSPFVELGGVTQMIGSPERMGDLLRSPVLGAYRISGDIVISDRHQDPDAVPVAQEQPRPLA